MTFEFEGTPPHTGVPLVNGHRVCSAEAIDVHIGALDVPRVTLRLLAADSLKLRLDSAAVEVAGETREALISLGWTPPACEQPSGSGEEP